MISLVPELHRLVGSKASRTIAQLRASGVEPGAHQVAIKVVVDRAASPGRQVLALALVDMLLRLDPLVVSVVLDAPGIEEALAQELALRLPLRRGPQGGRVDYSIGVGAGSAPVDLVIDAAGWVVAVGKTVDVVDDGNPVGPLAGASLASAEVFKLAFLGAYPDAPLELEPWRGVFSFYSYDADEVSPSIDEVVLDTTLVGLGGVGAGFVRTIAALGGRVSGMLRLVDADVLTTDNLNRVSYATLDGATRGVPKVLEARREFGRRCPQLRVEPYEMDFGRYKRLLGGRENRLYDVVVTGLDDDEGRWEVQRDLPRVLIDGATGKDMNTRIERVEFGRYGCLGCSRRRAVVTSDAPLDCDAPPVSHAPSVSFLSSLPGILAAGEVIKESLGLAPLRGSFDHIFRYGPNALLSGTAARRLDCEVGCNRQSKIDQYRRKYPSEDVRE